MSRHVNRSPTSKKRKNERFKDHKREVEKRKRNRKQHSKHHVFLTEEDRNKIIRQLFYESKEVIARVKYKEQKPEFQKKTILKHFCSRLKERYKIEITDEEYDDFNEYLGKVENRWLIRCAQADHRSIICFEYNEKPVFVVYDHKLNMCITALCPNDEKYLKRYLYMKEQEQWRKDDKDKEYA